MYVNKDDSHGSAELGDSAEQLFKKISEEKGYKVIDASKRENMMEHWDFRLENKDGLSFTFDVKGKKRLHRKAGFNDIIYIEYKSVIGTNGWIHGEADFIAFLLSDGFYIVKRKHLLRFATPLIKNKLKPLKSVRDKKPYTLYTRSQWGKKDQVMYIYKSDLVHVKGLTKWSV